MELLGNPQDELRCIHVAGTNGKGSTCAFIESILRCAGFKTGLFTSPYIERFEERIRVNNENIPLDRLTEITLRVKDVAEQVEAECGEHPTEFELMTAVAFVYFAEEACDYCVIEVGLGGRLDSTNIITPVVSVITKIGLDHTALLGDTIEKIAAEKAGIIKPGVPVVIAPNQEPAALAVLETKCQAPCLTMAQLCELPLGLTADYQKENAGNAVAVAKLLGISQDCIERGLLNATWPGRFEKFEVAGKTIIVDGAHNPDGARALVRSLRHSERSEESQMSAGPAACARPSTRADLGARDQSTAPASPALTAVFGILADKNWHEVLEITKPLFNEWYLYEPNNPRALSVEEIPVEGVKCNSATGALTRAIKEGSQNIVCFGSLYSIAEIRDYLIKHS